MVKKGGWFLSNTEDPGAGEMAWEVKGSLHKREQLSSGPSSPVKPGAAAACDSQALWPACLNESLNSMLFERCLKKN